MKTNDVNSNDTSATSSNIMKITDTNGTAKSDSKELDIESKEDSLSNMIASGQKTLFKSTPLAQDNNDDKITMATSRSKKWVPIKSVERTNTTPAKNTVLTAPSSSHKDATFVVDKNFKEQEAPVAKKTLAKKAETTEIMKECIARVCVKILAGVTDIQETVMGLLGNCLVILQECNKTACFVNAANTLKAHKLTDFP
jgi:hypothetical protein